MYREKKYYVCRRHADVFGFFSLQLHFSQKVAPKMYSLERKKKSKNWPHRTEHRGTGDVPQIVITMNKIRI